jgi:hypothetical protein
MDDHTKHLKEHNAAVEGGTQGQPHNVLNNDGTGSHMVLHAGAEKKRKRATATRKQISANRANATRSTGPRTLEGKEVVARNAIKHGLASRSVLLPGDDQRDYDIFSDDMMMSLAPEGPLEQELVQLIVDAKWVRRRVQRMESGALRYLTGAEIDAAVFADLWTRLPDSFNRYAAAKDRVIFRAIEELRRLQDRRKEERSSSPVQQFYAKQDELRGLQEVIAKRTEEIARRPIGEAKTNAEQAASPASPRILDDSPLKPPNGSEK